MTPFARVRAVPWLRRAVRGWTVRAHFAATVLGVLGFAGSLTPSLLPRTPVFQGVVTGVSTAAWLGAGVLLDSLFRRLGDWAGLRLELRDEVRRGLRNGWAGVLAAVLVLAPFLALDQQRRLARTFELPEPGLPEALLSGLVALVAFAATVGLWWLVRWLYEQVLRGLRRLHPVLASGLASLTVVALVVAVGQYVVLGGVLRVVGGAEESANAATPKGVSRPSLATLSGSPESLEAWESLGYEGRNFVGSAARRERIAEVAGREAMDPIRVYASTAGRDLPATTAAVLAEMDRTDAWSRSTIVVHTTTGRGWINRWSVASTEYLTAGDIASVAMQHSNLPSALALADAPSTPREAGRMLTDAVLERVESLPEAERPRVFVAGDSLGAYGSAAAFGSVDDLLARVDGAVWAGAPRFTALRRELTAQRQGGSTEVDPVIDNGAHVRFASEPAELERDQYGRALGEWRTPRVAVLHNRSDPVAWWSFDLLHSEPDWLREDRKGTSTAAMTWLPVITFWQVSADLAQATSPPSGEGHTYRDEVVPAWAAVLGVEDVDVATVIDAIHHG